MIDPNPTTTDLKYDTVIVIAIISVEVISYKQSLNFGYF